MISKNTRGKKEKRRRIGFWADKELVALMDQGAKKCGTSRAGFVRQAIKEMLPLLEAAAR